MKIDPWSGARAHVTVACMFHLRLPAVVVFSGLLAVHGLVACSDSAGDGSAGDGDGDGDTKAASRFCDEICECRECDDHDHEKCEEEFSEAKKIAADMDCADVFEDARACLLEDAECKGSSLDTHPCDDVGEKLDECTDGETKIDQGDAAPLRTG